AGRLWVRGRLVGVSVAAKSKGAEKRWWRRWRKQTLDGAAPPSVHLETRISGHLFEAQVPLEADGRFEAIFSAELPVARRGWRIARNRVTWNGRTVDQCGVVTRPPDGARRVAVVILPLDYTSQPQGAQRLARSEQAVRLAPVLRRLDRGPGDLHAIYYVACVPAHGDAQQAELALATMTLGWPMGNFLLLPLLPDGVNTIAAGVERLRWLFAGTLSLIVLNLEPEFSAALAGSVRARDDLAAVDRLVRPNEDPGALFADAVPASVTGAKVTIRPARSSLVPRYPVIFCQGMLAMTTLRMRLPDDLN